MTKKTRAGPLLGALGWCFAVVLLLSGCGGPTGRLARRSDAETTLLPITGPPTTGPPPTLPVTTTRTAPSTTTPSPPKTAPPTTLPPPTTSHPLAQPPTSAPCPDALPANLASTAGATQLITVEAASYRSQVATLTAWQREGSCWEAENGPWTAFVGVNGFSDHHLEGDGTTPTGIYGIGPVMYGAAPNPGVRYPYHQFVCGDWWDEDPTSPAYNTFVHVPCGESPAFGGDSEPLWTETNAYPSLAVIDYNTDRVVPGAGSGIFLHANIGQPTTGCVSLPLAELDQVLRWLDPSDHPAVVMGPTSEITDF